MIYIILLISAFIPGLIGGESSYGYVAWYLMSVLIIIWRLVSITLREDVQVVLYIALVCVLVVLIVNTIAIFPNLDGYRVFFELFRVIVFFLMFSFGFNAYLNRQQIPVKLLLNCIFFFCILYFLANFLFRDFIDDVELLYGKIDNVVSGRLFLPFFNPYDLAMALLIPQMVFLSRHEYIKALVVAVIIFWTQSRTGIIFMFLSIFLIQLSLLNIMTAVRNIFVLSTILIGFLAYAYIDDRFSGTYLVSNTLGLISGDSTSWTKRADQFGYLSDVPLFGYGAVPNSLLIIENGFLYEIVKNGVLSIVNIFFYYLIPLVLSVYVLCNGKEAGQKIAAVFIVSVFFAGLFNVFIYQAKFSLLYWGAYGWLVSSIFCKR